MKLYKPAFVIARTFFRRFFFYQDKHAILDITPTAVEKLNYAQLYPIVVFLQAPNKASVKELRSKLATTDEEKKKKSAKLFDRANKLYRGYNHVFTGKSPDKLLFGFSFFIFLPQEVLLFKWN